MMTVDARKINRLRLARTLSIEAIAEACKVSEPTAYRWCNEKRGGIVKIADKNAAKLASVLGCSTQEIKWEI